MKAESEIRKHRDDLLVAVNAPCNCAGTKHEFACFVGGAQMESAARVLSWVLDENHDMDRIVETISAVAKGQR